MGEIMNKDVVPGWYKDPTEESQLRYFDGSTWTAETKKPGGQTVSNVAGVSGGKASSSATGKPLARFRLKWYHFVFAYFTVGISLAYTIPEGRSQKAARQVKIDSYWGQYQELLASTSSPLLRFDYLFQDQTLATRPGGVVLEEARQGETRTTSGGTIQMKGSTSTIGAGVGIGAFGVGGADSRSNLGGTITSSGVSTTGKDRAVAIDEGQLKVSSAGLEFVGGLQVRSIPFTDMLGVGKEPQLLNVATRSHLNAQRFRFRDRFEAEVFHRVVTATIAQGAFPDLGSSKKDFEDLAAKFPDPKIETLKSEMKALI